jgi:galactokinase
MEHNFSLRRQKINQAFNDLMAYHGNHQMKLLIELLDAQIEEHAANLIDVSPEKLHYYQGAAQQLRALRSSLIDPERRGLSPI